MAGGKRTIPIVVATAALLVGCSSGTADLEQQLADVTAQRDALQEQVDTAAARHDLVVEKKAELEAVLADTDAYGDTTTVINALAAFATDDAKMVDDVFGSVGYRTGWYFTLYGNMDAEIDTIRQWVDADGSQTGALWIWHGTNSAGNPFSLIGVAIDDYNDEGLITNEWVTYPYDDEYVRVAVNGVGTPTDAFGNPWEEDE